MKITFPSLISLIANLLLPGFILAQIPDTLWTSSLGGSGTEVAGTNSPNSFGNNIASAAIDLVDGTSYLASASASTGVYGRSNAGGDDVLLVHLAQNGDTLWTKLFGGSGADRVYRIRSVSGGGIIAAGFTTSNNGDFTGNHGGYDGFLMKISSSGQIIWKKLYGGSNNDYLYDVVENTVGNFVACGESGSVDGDLAGAGNGLAWVIFINGISGIPGFSVAPNGPNSSNPNGLENFTTIKRLNNGSGYIMSGFTSPDFNNFNLDDIWVCKMTFTGSVVWNKTYGSNNARDGSAALIDMGNGAFMIAGILGGNGGYPNYRGGSGDGWLISCNAAGDTLWTKTYGGSDWDFFHDAVMDNDSNIYLAGFSRSSDQQLSGQLSYGLADYWIVKVNTEGDTLYTIRVGGSTFDAATGIACSGTPDDLLVAGRSDSNDGWVNGNNGGRDLWALRWSNPITGMAVIKRQELEAYPNPFEREIYVNISNNGSYLVLRDIKGREVFRMTNLQEGWQNIVIPSFLASGSYILEIINNEGSVKRLLMKR